MKLILIRHGKTEANEKHLYCGSTDIALSEEGKTELISLKQTKNYPELAGFRVLTSGMKRCDETLAILYGDIPHEVDPAFREIDFGAFEMRSYEEMKTDAAYIAWITGDNEENLTPGGESGNIMAARVTEALRVLIEKAMDTAIFTHGGVIAAMMAYLFPNEGKNRYEWQPKPGGGYAVDLTNQQYTAI